MNDQISIEWSTGRDQIMAALFGLQCDMAPLMRTKEATIRGKSRDGTPYEYSYSYADLTDTWTQLKPLLKEHGLVVVQGTELASHDPANWIVLVTEVHHVESGQYVRTYVPFPVNADQQRMGISQSYARRYALQLVTGMYTEDLDANIEGAAKAALAKTMNDNIPRIDALIKQYVKARDAKVELARAEDMRTLVDSLQPWQHEALWNELNSYQKATLREMLHRARQVHAGKSDPGEGEDDKENRTAARQAQKRKAAET